MIELILGTNEKLYNKSKEFDEPILEMEKNTTEIISNFDDFSNILRGPMNNMYSEITNFSSELFLGLIDLIKNIHQNYSSILNNIKQDKYPIFSEIRAITKNEYMNYINSMISKLENFYNNTLLFFNDIKNKLTKINDFQIDFLYDIIDSVNDTIELFENFIKKLFLSIEKGIISFKFELNDFIENIIGELLYITDFLSVNFNKNEKIIKNIGEHKRNETIILLKDFRNIINIIVDLLIDNIYNDYKSDYSKKFSLFWLNVNNDDSIKIKSTKKIEQYISKIKRIFMDLLMK